MRETSTRSAKFSKMVSYAAAAALTLTGTIFSIVSSAQEVLPVPPAPFKGQIGLSAQDSKSDFPVPIRAPEWRPQHRARAFG